ncbi:hypothetical protein ACSSS7_001765 [Eimeria intestinalis]
MEAPSDPRSLLDSNAPFTEASVHLLDRVVAAMFGCSDQHSRDVAHRVLGEFKNMPNAWTHVAVILNVSQDANTKFFALQILESTITTRWNVLPETERNGIKAFVTSLVIQLASDPQQCHTEKHFINKVNENLIEIVKREWPERWPSFITEVCQSCRSSQSICENNMRLLNMLSEEVFDFGRNEMVSKRVDKLMDQLTAQFQEVYDTCMFVLKSFVSSPAGMRETLVQQTLKCLAHFLKWVPLGFIFETDLIETLLQHFWEPVQYRPECIRCVTEMASLQLSPEEAAAFRHRLAAVWVELVARVVALPRQTLQYEDPGKVPPQMRLFWESIYCQLALCLTAPGQGSLLPADLSWRVRLYANVLNDVRGVMIRKMAKPQEIYIQFDQETGEVTREYEVDTAEISLYNTMRCTQVLLTNLGQIETQRIMLSVLSSECMQAPVQGENWNSTSLNRLCYSIEDERSFVLSVIEGHTQQTDVLDEKQQLLFFEAVGHIVSATPDATKTDCINGLMINCNNAWKDLVMAAQAFPDVIYDAAAARRLVHILRINQRVAKSTGTSFTPQLMKIYSEMMQVYGLYGQRMLQEVQRSGPSRIKHADVKCLHVFKRETLHLLEIYVDKAAQEGGSTGRKEIVKEMVGQVLQPILADYRDNTPDTRDCEVLTLLSVLMSRLDSHIASVLPVIFEYVFDCTLQMIKTDFQSYPDHRERFYGLLKACNQFCFDGLFSLPSAQLKAFVESLVWAFKHEHPSLAEEGLQVTYEFLQKIIEGKREGLRFLGYD